MHSMISAQPSDTKHWSVAGSQTVFAAFSAHSPHCCGMPPPTPVLVATTETDDWGHSTISSQSCALQTQASSFESIPPFSQVVTQLGTVGMPQAGKLEQ